MLTKIRLHKKINNLVKNNKDEYTNPEIQKNIKKFGVLVDGILIFNRLEWIYQQTINYQHWPKRDKTDFSKIKILYEDNNLLVIYKPSKVVVEIGSGHQYDNLISYLKQKEPNTDYQPIHRLDKETSGILLIAKTQSALNFFQSQFKKRQVIKKYLALVKGKLEKSLYLKTYQSRNIQNPLEQKLFWEFDDKYKFNQKESISNFIPQLYCPEIDQTLIEVQIFTGRMHQIRLQLQNLGLSIVGDTIYTQKYEHNSILSKILEIYPNSVQILNNFPKIKNINKKEFLIKSKNIFEDNEMLLKANYLKIKNLDNSTLELII